MFDSPLDFLSLVIAIAALIFARKAYNQADQLRARLDAMQALASSAAARPTPPPVPAVETLEQPQETPSPGIAAEQTAIAPEPPSPELATTATIPAVPPPLAPAEAGFEERIGTRWVVWIGGLTLALGGFFLVRYSIEAGLLGPRIRTLLGGAPPANGPDARKASRISQPFRSPTFRRS